MIVEAWTGGRLRGDVPDKLLASILRLFLANFLSSYILRLSIDNYAYFVLLCSLALKLICLLVQPASLKRKAPASIYLWMNNGQARSSTHHNRDHNFLCAVAGLKQGIDISYNNLAH